MTPILLIIQFLIFFGYVVFVRATLGQLASISDSYYSLPDNQKFLFPMFTWSMGITLFLVAYDTHIVWYFVSAGFITLVGVADQFKLDQLIDRIHVLSATLSVVTAMVALAYQGVFYPLPAAVVFLVVLHAAKAQNNIWWMEIASYSLVMSGFLVKLLHG